MIRILNKEGKEISEHDLKLLSEITSIYHNYSVYTALRDSKAIRIEIDGEEID